MAKKQKIKPETMTEKMLKKALSDPVEQRYTHYDVTRMSHDSKAKELLSRAKTAEQRRKAKEEYLASRVAERQGSLAAIKGNREFGGAIEIAKPIAGRKATPTLTDSQYQRLRALAKERIERRRESLKLWQPMATQNAFHNCTAKERIVYGSNRSGKTTCAAVEFARMVTGNHVHLSGKRLPKENGIAGIVGYDESHCGRVMYRKLFKPGAFRIIKDQISGEWRPYEPDGLDKGRPKQDGRPAPPLIPKRMVAEISWAKKKDGIPRKIILTNGWELRFYSSKADPPQGDALHIYWFDEEIENESWYTEASRGLLDESGFFMWSATPHVGGDDLIDLHNRAEKGINDPNCLTREFFLLMFDNQHVSKADKDELVEKFKDKPEAYRTRILGEFAAKAFKVYPEFSMDRHGFDIERLPGGRVPADWCRYVAIDPGFQVQCALFVAVPPPGVFRQKWYLYDELYVERGSAAEFAKQMEVKTRGQSFEAFIIDMRAGRVTTYGGEKPVEQIYRDSFRKVTVKDNKEPVNIWERVNLSTFIPGADNPKAGVQAVKEALVIDSASESSQIVFARGRLPNLEREMEKYHHKRVKGKITDQLTEKDNHCCDCVRYIVSFRPEHKRPAAVKKPMSAAAKRLRDKAARLDNGSSNTVNLGPRSSRLLSAG